jgi:translation initiation factor 2 beta subunit (eIF-2beta)/eIF-5
MDLNEKGHYTEDHLISRVHSTLKERREDIDENTSFVLPHVEKVNKTTVIANFAAICEGFNRTPEEVKYYILSEMNAMGSLNERGQLIIKNMLKQNMVSRLLSKYVNKFVICPSCRKSKDTVAIMDNRIKFIKCNFCGVETSIQK